MVGVDITKKEITMNIDNPKPEEEIEGDPVPATEPAAPAEGEPVEEAAA